MGAGRTELAETIMGLRTPDSGEIYLNGEKIVNRIPEDAIKRGIIMVPEDRKKNGLVLKLGIRDNILMSSIGKCVRNGVIRKSLEKELCKKEICWTLREAAMSSSAEICPAATSRRW